VRPVRVSLLVAGYVALISRMSEPSLPLTARGRFGDTRSRLAAGSGWRKPQAPHSLLEAGLGKGSITARGRFEPKHCGTPRHTAGRRAHRADDSTSDIKTTTQKPPPTTNPDRRPSRPSPAGGVIFLLSGVMCYGSWAFRESHG
jgi:hypothetical protein